MVTEATEAAKAETARLVAEAEAAKAETARLVADAAQAVQQWGIGGLGRNLVGQIGELGKPPPQWAPATAMHSCWKRSWRSSALDVQEY